MKEWMITLWGGAWDEDTPPIAAEHKIYPGTYYFDNEEDFLDFKYIISQYK